MILVTGTVIARTDTVDELLAISLDHVRRSRAEPGCISHHVHRHAEDPLTLVFVERWTDIAALKTHFAMPESGETVRRMSALTSAPPTMQVYEAAELSR